MPSFCVYFEVMEICRSLFCLKEIRSGIRAQSFKACPISLFLFFEFFLGFDSSNVKSSAFTFILSIACALTILYCDFILFFTLDAECPLLINIVFGKNL